MQHACSCFITRGKGKDPQQALGVLTEGYRRLLRGEDRSRLWAGSRTLSHRLRATGRARCFPALLWPPIVVLLGRRLGLVWMSLPPALHTVAGGLRCTVLTVPRRK